MEAALNIKKWQEEDLHELKKQLDLCSGVHGKLREFVEDYLIQRDIYSLEEINEQIKEDYYRYVDNKEDVSNERKKYYKNLLEQVQNTYLISKYPEFYDEMTEVITERSIRNKLFVFLMDNDVVHVNEMSYKFREKYEVYLNTTVAKTKVLEYLKAFDKLKLESIKRENNRNILKKTKLEYKNEKIFLLYHPNYEIAKKLYYIRDKKRLVFDFSLKSVSGVLKHQIYKMLNHILEKQMDSTDFLEKSIIPLKKLYVFCAESGIEDIEQLTNIQIDQFRESLLKQETKHRADGHMQIVDNICKYLFVNAKQINWNANYWYLERFNLNKNRVNAAHSTKKFAFGQIVNEDNRGLFKEFMKYELGVGQKALQTVKGRYYKVKDIFLYCDEINKCVLQLTKKDYEQYISLLDEKKLEPETYNMQILSVLRMLDYFIAKEKLKYIPVDLHCYLKKVLPKHWNRVVPEDIQLEILEALRDVPEKLRLMYLNLWCVGLRVSEVCTIKGDAYSWDGQDAWLRVYQDKLKREKCIPIPLSLYELMQNYIKKENIKADDYIFQAQKRKGAYCEATFCKQMKKYLKEAGVNDYNFRAHDFRHTVASRLYSHNVSIEVIRDYLGHTESDMTKQYIDYMQDILDKKNEEYFQKNKLAGYAGRKDKNGR